MVTAGIWAFGALFMGGFSLGTALVLGAIASATAPAATIAVIEEYKAKGPLTRTLLSLVAIDDMLAIVFFTLVMSLTAAGAEAGRLSTAAREIGLSLAAGAVLGLGLGWFARRIESDELRLPVILGFVFLTLGLAGRLEFSPLLSCMVLGYMSKLVAAEESDLCLSPMSHIREAIFLIFFTLAGVHFQFHVFVGAAGFIAAYILLRTAGKYSGAFAGTWLGGAPAEVRNNERGTGPAAPGGCLHRPGPHRFRIRRLLPPRTADTEHHHRLHHCLRALRPHRSQAGAEAGRGDRCGGGWFRRGPGSRLTVLWDSPSKWVASRTIGNGVSGDSRRSCTGGLRSA